jgi:hypothetical protein
MIFATAYLGGNRVSDLQEKRVVVYVVTGRRKGMRRIIGHMIFKAGDELPKRFDNVYICKGEPARTVHLVGEYPRYVMYREMEPAIKPPRSRKAKIIANDGRPEAS